jgi:hypothetical protein
MKLGYDRHIIDLIINYLAFQPFNFNLMKKHVVHTKFDIYVFIEICGIKMRKK